MSSRTPSRSVSSASLPLDVSTPEIPDDETAEKKVQIMSACRARDLTALVHLAASDHGLVDDSLRRTAWPILLGCSGTTPTSKDHPDWSTLPPHPDEEQVAKDVNRAFVSYPKESEKQLDRRKQQLSDIIVEFLRRYPALHYFQGFHDIIQVLYLVLGPEDASPSVARLSLLRIRDYMLPAIEPAIRHLELLPAILRAQDPILYNHLPKMQPNYALGATLTLFSHVIDAYGDITRLFDFFLASDAAVPVYFFASIVLSRREELLELEEDEDETIFFVMLGKLPKPFDLESRIKDTVKLHNQFRPESLGWPWWRVSTSSVLKSSKSTFDVANMSLEEGQKLFQRQERELRVQSALQTARLALRRVQLQAWRHRRPGTIGLAIAVGIYAVWLGRSGDLSVHRYLGPLSNALRTVMSTFA